MTKRGYVIFSRSQSMSEAKLDLKSGHRKGTDYTVEGNFIATVQHDFKTPRVPTPNQTAMQRSSYVSILAPPLRVRTAGSAPWTPSLTADSLPSPSQIWPLQRDRREEFGWNLMESICFTSLTNLC